jgi:hypothetical protein
VRGRKKPFVSLRAGFLCLAGVGWRLPAGAPQEERGREAVWVRAQASGTGRRVCCRPIDPRTKRIRVESYTGFARDAGYGDGKEEAEAEGVDGPPSRVPPPLSMCVGSVGQ